MDVRLYGPEALEWPFEGKASFRVGAGRYPRLVEVDPFPAYAPDLALVTELVAECCERFPLRAGAESCAVLSREVVSRVNGWASTDTVWNRPDGTDWEDEIASPFDGKIRKVRGQALSITLSAKRIPIHPAMVRYVVPHQYGHCAFYAAARRLGYQDHEMKEAEAAYLKVRGSENTEPAFYGGGTWHASGSEIIANDFRILVMGRELEFWPHPTFSAPAPGDAIAAWWERAKQLLEVEPAQTVAPAPPAAPAEAA